MYLMLVRAFSGTASSIIMTTMPMLFSEFVEPSQRGIFASMMNLFIVVGTLLSNIV